MAHRTSDGWKVAQDELPDREKFGPYPVAEVILQCNSSMSGDGEPWQRLQLGELRFLGGNPARPVWVSVNKPQDPIENGAWFVSHWRPIPSFPKPIPVKSTQDPK